MIGEMLRRDKHSLKIELVKFCKGDPMLQHEKHGAIFSASLLKSWPKVKFVIMQFIKLNITNLWERKFHLNFLNHLKGMKMNILTFLYAELDKVIEDYQKRNGNEVYHQG